MRARITSSPASRRNSSSQSLDKKKGCEFALKTILKSSRRLTSCPRPKSWRKTPERLWPNAQPHSSKTRDKNFLTETKARQQIGGLLLCADVLIRKFLPYYAEL